MTQFEKLQNKLNKQYGYKLGADEIHGLYEQGELALSDAEENALLDEVEGQF